MADTYYEAVHRKLSECETKYNECIAKQQYREAYEAAYTAREVARRIVTGNEPQYMKEIYRKKFDLWDSRMKSAEQGNVGVSPSAPGRGPGEPKFPSAAVSSDICFNDIAGLEDVKQMLRDKVIGPIDHPEVVGQYKKKPSRTLQVLLYGPPGTGKTMFAEALANELKMTMHRCKASDIIGSLLGESIQNMEAFMQSIINDESEKILAFIDEFDALAGRRTGENKGADGEMNRLVNQLLQCIDEMVKSNKDKSIVFVATTNLPWNIDPAILRGKRLDTQIYVGLPDKAARQFLVKKALDGGTPPLAKDVDLDALADRLKGYSSADITSICDKISDEPLFRHYHTGRRSEVTRADIDLVLGRSPKSVTEADLARYELYNKERGYKTPKID